MTPLSVLPARMRLRSRSTEEIIMSIDQVVRAIDILSAAGWAMRGWEGLIVYSNGTEERPTEFQRELGIGKKYSEAWEDFVRRSALLCRTSIMESYNAWSLSTNAKNAQFWVCLQAEDSD